MDMNDYEHLRNLTLLFFLEKLLDKGESRSLHDLSCQFGTKGFSKEMRQIAGGSKAGLRRFLCQYPALFKVEDDRVSIAQIVTHSSATSTCPEGSSDVRDYSFEAMLYFKEKLKQYGEGIEVPIKSLLGHRSQAPPEVRHFSGQHIKDFREFLLKYEDHFVVTEDTIYLKEYEGSVKLQMYSESNGITNSNDIQSPKNTTTPAVSDTTDQRRRDINRKLLDFMKSFLSQRDMELDQMLELVLNEFDPENEEVDLPFRTEANLRAFLKVYPSIFTLQGRKVGLANKRTTNLTSNPSSPSRSLRTVHDSPTRQQNLTLKDRVSSVVMKAMADNSQRGTTPRTEDYSNSVGRIGSVKVLVEGQECKTLVNKLIASENHLAVDVKGSNLGPEGTVSSVHLGTADGNVYIFDALALPQTVMTEYLKQILEDENITKVMHDCRNESATLWFRYGINLCNVFDSQAAHAVIQQQEYQTPVHKVKNMSISALCKVYNIPAFEILEQLKTNNKRDPKLWGRRPFDSDTLHLASLEVNLLVCNIYPKLKRQMKEESLALFDELCEEQLRLYIEPDIIKSKKNQRKIDLEVQDIRTKLNSANGKNVVLSNREIRLLRFLDLTEDDVKKIKGSTKVAKKLERLCNSNEIDGNDDSNPPSLESVSSGSGNSPLLSQPNSLSGYESGHQTVQGLERIEKLEAIIANITNIENDDQNYSGSPENSILPSTGSVISTRSVETQTLSTGDIVMTKVFSS